MLHQIKRHPIPVSRYTLTNTCLFESTSEILGWRKRKEEEKSLYLGRGAYIHLWASLFHRIHPPDLAPQAAIIRWAIRDSSWLDSGGRVWKQGCTIVGALETCFQPLLNVCQPHLAGCAKGPSSQMVTGWLGRRFSQPIIFFRLDASHMSIRQLNKILSGAIQMAGTQPNGWDSAKWLGLKPIGWDSEKLCGLSQMAGTHPNGCDLAKWLRLSQIAATQPNSWRHALSLYEPLDCAWASALLYCLLILLCTPQLFRASFLLCGAWRACYQRGLLLLVFTSW